ncbi:DUF2949 domain-containing protein [Candidatus Cyanaurora vandensis]|nr:DUF2949 domain-containing protein [Candidatus Cyanaurora vandensis]
MNTHKLLQLVTGSQLELAQKIQRREQGTLEIILWRLGFLTREQLGSIL